MITRKEIERYYEGMRVGIHAYAWMRDGVYYVGTTGRTLEQAIAEVDQREIVSLKNQVGIDQ